MEGIFSLHLIDASILVSLGRSILVAFGAVIICLFITFSLGSVIVTSNIRSKVRWLMESSAYFIIASSPLVIGTGFFIFLFPIINPIKIVFPMTALINAIMAVPFSLRIILPAMQKINQDYGKLSESIGLRGYEKIFNLTIPRMKREIGFSVGLISALSIGDLGVVTLFSSPQSGTLPLTIYRLMGSYQMDAAKAAAFLLLISCFIIFLLTDRLARSNVKD
jgi:thiamine transport system permease protein